MAVAQHFHPDHGPEFTIMQARQARRGRHMAWVLGVSMALAVVGMTALYLFHLPHLQVLSDPFQTAGAPAQPKPQDKGSDLTPGIGVNGQGL